MHGRVATALNQNFADLVERQPELLAYHLTAAGDTERAVDQWLKAGRHAAERSAHVEAIGHFEHGLAALSAQGGLSNFNRGGAVAATIGGILGAVGAVCIIWAFRSGGSALYVMLLVFGGAPIINVVYSMILHPPKAPPGLMWYAGLLLASMGAGMVLYFRPVA